MDGGTFHKQRAGKLTNNINGMKDDYDKKKDSLADAKFGQKSQARFRRQQTVDMEFEFDDDAVDTHFSENVLS